MLYRQAQARVEIVARLANEFGVHDGTAGIGAAGGLEFEVSDHSFDTSPLHLLSFL